MSSTAIYRTAQIPEDNATQYTIYIFGVVFNLSDWRMFISYID
jgi:hypothetical protein